MPKTEYRGCGLNATKIKYPYTFFCVCVTQSIFIYPADQMLGKGKRESFFTYGNKNQVKKKMYAYTHPSNCYLLKEGRVLNWVDYWNTGITYIRLL